MIGYSIAIHSLALLQQVPPTIPDNQTQVALEALRRRPQAEDVLVPLFFFVFLAIAASLRMRQRQRRMQTQADLHKQLLDKFSSGSEFAAFMDSSGGQRYLAELRTLNSRTTERTLVWGVIGVLAGLCMLALAHWMPAATAPNRIPFISQMGFVVWGALFLAVGAGLLISFTVSRRLSKPPDNAGGPAGLIS